MKRPALVTVGASFALLGVAAWLIVRHPIRWARSLWRRVTR